MDTILSIAGPDLAAGIALHGAELKSLRDGSGREWLWPGDPRSWPRTAPVLFPVVGRCAGGVIRHRGTAFPMPQHGFARDRDFAVVDQAADTCRLRLAADAETRRAYPFAFSLDLTFAIAGNRLAQTAVVTNTGAEPLAASVGFHPGFRWPLASCPGAAKADHVIVFESDEPHPIRQLDDGLLSPVPCKTPVAGARLKLAESLFRDGALVFDRLESRALWFGVPGEPGLSVTFPDCPHLGIWMLPGADFLCIEPWQGHTDPKDFTGELSDKPGTVCLAPGKSLSRGMTVAVGVMPAGN